MLILSPVEKVIWSYYLSWVGDSFGFVPKHLIKRLKSTLIISPSGNISIKNNPLKLGSWGFNVPYLFINGSFGSVCIIFWTLKQIWVCKFRKTLWRHWKLWRDEWQQSTLALWWLSSISSYFNPEFRTCYGKPQLYSCFLYSKTSTQRTHESYMQWASGWYLEFLYILIWKPTIQSGSDLPLIGAEENKLLWKITFIY